MQETNQEKIVLTQLQDFRNIGIKVDSPPQKRYDFPHAGFDVTVRVDGKDIVWPQTWFAFNPVDGVIEARFVPTNMVEMFAPLSHRGSVTTAREVAEMQAEQVNNGGGYVTFTNLEPALAFTCLLFNAMYRERCPEARDFLDRHFQGGTAPKFRLCQWGETALDSTSLIMFCCPVFLEDDYEFLSLGRLGERSMLHAYIERRRALV